MDDRWIALSTYAEMRDVNADADFLKSMGIDCKVSWNEPEQAFFVVPDHRDHWILLKVHEDDYEEAAEILELEPYTIETIYSEHHTPAREGKRKRGLLFWGSIFSAIIVLKLLVDFL